MTEGLVDRIYEAAFVPELWPGVLDDLAASAQSVSGSVLVFTGLERPPTYRTTELTRESLLKFTTTDRWRQSRRVEALYRYMISGDYSGFHYLNDLLNPEQVAEDSVELSLRELDLGAQITTLVPLLSSEVVAYTFERRADEGRHSLRTIAWLNELRPHLARSGLLAARLGLERAQAMVSALNAIGLPAAVIHGAGRVQATNTLFDKMDWLFLPLAFDGMALADPAAAPLLREAVKASSSHIQPLVRSIPVASRDGRPACVVHVVPICRSAHDIFSGGDLLVAATVVGAGMAAPSSAILAELFDFSPSEVKLAVALASGATTNEAAAQGGITLKTARTYLERLFAKTGTHRQSELIALLRSTSPLAG